MIDGYKAIAGSLALAVAFFILDCFLPRGFAAGLPYVACVLIGFWSPRRTDILLIASVCAALTFTGYVLSQDPVQSFNEFNFIPIVNRCLSVFAILVTALNGWGRKTIEYKLQESNLKLAVANEKLEMKASKNEQKAEAQRKEISRIETSLSKEAESRKIAEETYEQTIARFRSLIEALPINVFQKDTEGRLTFGNRRYFETLGMAEADAIGKTDFDLFPKDLATKYFQDDQRVVSQGVTIEDIEEHIRLAGEKLYVQVFKAPVIDAENKIVGSQGMFWDVTARILAEQAQQQSDARFRRLVKSNIIGIMSGTFDGRVLDANEAYLNMIGYSLEDVVKGRLRWDEITPSEYRILDREMEETLQKQSYCPPIEKEYVHKTGRRVHVLMGAARLEGTDSECICFVLDITERKRAEIELRRAMEAADAANRTKTLFLANISHEVRTPLNAIIGMTELVLQNHMAPDQREYLRMVLESGESLLHIIDDILDFSKVEAGKLTLDPRPMRLREKLSETLRSMAIRAHGKGLELVFDVASDVPDNLIGDAGRLRQVLVNLVGNAVKFTEEGEVVVTAVLADEGEEDVTLHFSVSDTGIGISPKEQKLVFEAFEQADNTSTRRYGGTGLGLAICSNLVELMGGTIWLESEVNKGSTFHFTCRLVNHGLDEDDEPKRLTSHSRVLIVDDNLASANSIADMMLGWDLTPVVAQNADRGMELFQESVDERAPFDLILVDSDMPVEDGFRFIERILEFFEIDSVHEMTSDVLMMLNSTNSTKGIARCEAMGLNGYLMKPISPSDLFDAASISLGKGFDEVTKAGTRFDTKVCELPPLRILLAEDSLVNQKLIVGLLGQHQHEVRLAQNGAQAVESFQREAFDLILMDVQMPEMNGYDATRKIRSLEAGKKEQIPIIALTAHAGTEDRRECLAAGMNEFITKPIRAQRLFDIILSVLAENSPALIEDSGIEKPKSKDTVDLISEIEGSDNPSGRNSIDWAKAMSAVNDDEELIRNLIHAFFEECPGLMASMDLAIAEGQGKLLQQSAHTLKGSMRLFGASSGYDLTYRLENMGSENRFTNAAAALSTLKGEIEKISNELLSRIN